MLPSHTHTNKYKNNDNKINQQSLAPYGDLQHPDILNNG